MIWIIIIVVIIVIGIAAKASSSDAVDIEKTAGEVPPDEEVIANVDDVNKEAPVSTNAGSVNPDAQLPDGRLAGDLPPDEEVVVPAKEVEPGTTAWVPAGDVGPTAPVVIPGAKEIPGYKFYSRQNVPESSGYGKAFANLYGKPEELALKCNDDIDCHGFDTNGDLKNSYAEIADWNVDAANRGFYKKTEWGKPPHATGYEYDPDHTYSHKETADKGNIPKLREMCDKDVYCVGFSAEGWLKRTTDKALKKIKSKNPLKGFFTRKKLPDGNLFKDTYIWKQGHDLHGTNVAEYGSLKDKPAEIKKKCDEDVRCMGFNTNGYLKGNPGWQPDKDRPWQTDHPLRGSYIKKNVPKAKEFDDYKFHLGIRSNNDFVYRNKEKKDSGNVEKLRQICNSDPACFGFLTNGYFYDRPPMSDTTGWDQSNPLSGLYVRNNPAEGKSTDDYDFYKERNFHGGILARYPDLRNKPEDLMAKCDDNKNCRGFNTDGYLWNSHNFQLAKGDWNKGYPARGSYVKKNVVRPSPIDGYEFKQGTRSNNDFVYRKADPKYAGNVGELKRICDADSRCYGFLTNGYLYDRDPTKDTTTYEPGDLYAGMYTRKDWADPGVSDRFDFTKHRAQTGGEAYTRIADKDGNIKELARICESGEHANKCVGFRSDGNLFRRKPDKLDRVWPGHPYQGYYTRKNIPAPPKLDGYTFKQQIRSNNDFVYRNQEKKHAGNPAELKKMCDADSRCYGFLTNGYMYDRPPMTDTIGWGSSIFDGMYIKKEPWPDPGVSSRFNFTKHRSTTGGRAYTRDASKSGDIKALADLCESATHKNKCVGFRSDGHLYDIKPTKLDRAWPGHPHRGYYGRKNLPMPPEQDGYKFKQGIRANNDFVYRNQEKKHANNPAELKKMCDEDEKCFGFLTNGYLYDRPPMTDTINWGSSLSDGMYVRNKWVPKSLPNYEWKPGVAITGNKLAGSYANNGLVDKIKTQCDNDVQCMGFHTNGKLVGLVGAGGTPVKYNTHPWYGSYVKKAPAKAKEFADYIWKQGHNIAGNILKPPPSGTPPSSTTLRSQCNAIPQCKGFNTDGYLLGAANHKLLPNWHASHPLKGSYVRKTMPKPAPVPNYDFKQGYRSNNDFVYRKRLDLAGKASEIAKACDADSRCYGFLTNGYLYKQDPRSDTVPWEAHDEFAGVYTKQSWPDPGISSRFDFTKHRAQTGGQAYTRITAKDSDIKELARICESGEHANRCVGFRSDGNLFQRKPDKLDRVWPGHPHQGYYTRKNIPKPPPLTGYSFHQGIRANSDFVYKTGTNNNRDANKTECDKDPNCFGFLTNGQMYKKNPLSDTALWGTLQSEGIYKKEKWNLPSVPDYTFNQGWNFTGAVLDKHTTLANNAPQLRLKCNANRNCLGFNTDGYLLGKPNFARVQTRWNLDNPLKGTYVRTSPPKPSNLDGYTFKQGHRGNTAFHLRVLPAAMYSGQRDAIKKICDQEEGCYGFRTDGVLYKKPPNIDTAAWEPSDLFKGIYTRTKWNIKQFPGYSWKKGISIAGNKLNGSYTQGGNVVEIKKQCDADPTCRGFDTNGKLVGSIGFNGGGVKFDNYPFWGSYVKHVPENPAPIEGYTYYKHKDGGQYNLATYGNFKNNAEALANECNIRGTCTGFNTNGYLKHGTISASKDWNGGFHHGGLWIRNKKDFNDVPGYTFHVGKDSTGSTVAYHGALKDQARRIALECDKRADCKGFNTNGYLKNSPNRKDWNGGHPSRGFYVKDILKAPTITKRAAGYTRIPGMTSAVNILKDMRVKGILGVSMPYTDVTPLKDACNADPNCKSFSTEGYLYSTKGNLHKWKPNNIYTMYEKDEGTKPMPIPYSIGIGYGVYPNTDIYGYDITRHSPTLTNPTRSACNADPKCKGYNSSNYLKHVIYPNKMRDSSLTMYRKLEYPKPASTIPRYNVYPKKTVTGGGFLGYHPGKSIDTLARKCRNTQNCMAFDSMGRLWANAKMTDDANLTTYLRTG